MKKPEYVFCKYCNKDVIRRNLCRHEESHIHRLNVLTYKDNNKKNNNDYIEFSVTKI